VSKVTELREPRMVPVDDRNHSFSITVPPGDVRVVKIVEEISLDRSWPREHPAAGTRAP
jgi:hypothetical protein